MDQKQKPIGRDVYQVTQKIIEEIPDSEVILKKKTDSLYKLFVEFSTRSTCFQSCLDTSTGYS